MFTLDDFKPIRFKLWKVILCVFIIWLIFFLSGHSFHTKKHGPSCIHDGQYLMIPEDSPYRKALVIDAVKKTKCTVPLTVPAVVMADPLLVLNVYVPVVGRIGDFQKKLGDFVKKGDLLFKIESSEFARAQSDYGRAKAAFSLATQILDRQKKLRQASIASQSDLQTAQNNYEQTHQEYERALARMKLLSTQSLEKNNASLSVRAQQSGYITEIYASNGVYWQDVSSPILTITDLAHVFVTASIQEKDIDQFYLGQPIAFVFDAFSEVVKTKLDWFNPVINPETRTLSVGATLNNTEKLQFKPNMFAQGTVQGSLHDGFLLPITAVLQRGFDSLVFVEIAPWTFQSRLVKTGAQLGDKIEILSGLSEKERVVIKGGILLND